MNYRQWVINYFTYNKKEQRGMVVLISLLILVVSANHFLPYLIPEKRFDFSGFAKEIKAFERDLAISDSMEKKGKLQKLRIYGHPLPGNRFDTLRKNKPEPRISFMIELNQADTFELQRLRGIGPAFARRIINYRERLGGFTNPAQLLEIYGLDSAKYTGIKEHIRISAPATRKIDLNKVTFKELLSHPYFPYELTREIMIYRKEHKKFQSCEELRQIKGVTDAVYRKIIPYIGVN